jgi:hypothetical protein
MQVPESCNGQKCRNYLQNCTYDGAVESQTER